uniref:Anaphase-promoting complex subunit 4 WD40 domain-containing protein n=1 Tax=Chromera velia CCMP2878 TaxID=1169474 RepID=A0A0G4GW59_9ALVE|eukprot:Cvel_23580.t1-p1 / transcript=Cvel_23580.t1 / gene=Cvel_23580 / organism=Chromera_velia_CCMP2878 / gene_product=Poly(A) RNA export protein, putative / transcript_product=Poly(A) RNA export protein, putative / location=Cvel_scaffold2447:12332-13573(+) / protein_length=414 / sequence_SO=supercontig / SO=protein_coding / is_pseudo=false
MFGGGTFGGFGQQQPQQQSVFGGAPAAAAGGIFGQPAGGGAFGQQGQAQGQFGQNAQNQQVSFYDIPGVPDDTISSLAWAKQGFVLACGSWDNSVRVWEIQTSNMPPFYNAIQRCKYDHAAPVLCVAWQDDSTALFSSSVDGEVKMYQIQSQQAKTVGKHDRGARFVYWVQELNCIVSGGWDGRVRFWQGQPNPVADVQLPERIFAMDVKFPVMVAATADHKVHIWNLQNLAQNSNPLRSIQMPNLKMQTRCLTLFPDKAGYAAGSVEGRCTIAWLEQQNPQRPGETRNFAFKCHRITPPGKQAGADDEIYPVSSIDFHPQMGTFATGGDDGTFVFWDKENKQRLKVFDSIKVPITCVKFSPDGSTFACATGYDWHKGHQGNTGQVPTKILLMKVDPENVKPKPKTAPTQPGRR